MKHLIIIYFADNISVGYNMSNITVEESVGSVELCAVITSGEGLRPFNLTVNTIKMTAGYQITINQAITCGFLVNSISVTYTFVPILCF